MSAPGNKVSIKYRIEYAALRFARFLLLLVPVGAASFSMGKLWRFFARFNPRHQRVLRHLDWALGEETTPLERQQIAIDMWENLGRIFAEALISDRILSQPSRIIANNATFNHWRDECHEGSVIVSHHFGNWELVGAPAVLFANRQNLGIYKRIKNPLVEEYLVQQRLNQYPGGLYSQRRGAAKKAVKHLISGKDVSMIADIRDNHGVSVPLFNMPANMPSFPAMLARKFDKPLFAAQMRRVKGASFCLDMVEIVVPRTNDIDEDVAIATRAIHQQFEKWVRQNPEQWMWAPFRWSGREQATKRPPAWLKTNKSRTPNSLDI